MFERVKTILDKEWNEVFKNKMVLFTVIFMPLLFTLMPLIMLGVTSGDPSMAGETTDMPAAFTAACENVSAGDCVQIFMMNEFMLLFMMMPLIIPINIAAYSIVGEKTTRSLEPLLATPISTVELLLGKGLAATLPAVFATWLCFGIFAIAAPLIGASQAVVSYIISPIWLIGVLVIGPLFAVASVIIALIVSSRVSDPRVAEQISAVVIIPVLAVLFAQIGGILILDVQAMILGVMVMLAADIGLVALAAQLFQREVILTRWK